MKSISFIANFFIFFLKQFIGIGIGIDSVSGTDSKRIDLGKLFQIFGPEQRIAWAHFAVEEGAWITLAPLLVDVRDVRVCP